MPVQTLAHLVGHLPTPLRRSLRRAIGGEGHAQHWTHTLWAWHRARGEKRIDRIGPGLAASIRDTCGSVEGRSCLEFGRGHLRSEALVFWLAGGARESWLSTISPSCTCISRAARLRLPTAMCCWPLWRRRRRGRPLRNASQSRGSTTWPRLILAGRRNSPAPSISFTPPRCWSICRSPMSEPSSPTRRPRYARVGLPCMPSILKTISITDIIRMPFLQSTPTGGKAMRMHAEIGYVHQIGYESSDRCRLRRSRFCGMPYAKTPHSRAFLMQCSRITQNVISVLAGSCLRAAPAPRLPSNCPSNEELAYGAWLSTARGAASSRATIYNYCDHSFGKPDGRAYGRALERPSSEQAHKRRCNSWISSASTCSAIGAR